MRMMEVHEVNSTFYALRLLSHGLDISEIEVTDGEEYPASEFTKEEQQQGLEIIHNIEALESISIAQLSSDQIDFHLRVLSDRIGELADRDLANAGYDIETRYLSPDESTEKEPTPNVPNREGRLRVLIACDNDLLRAVFRAQLEEEFGIEVTEARDGHEAVRLAREHQPDIVFLEGDAMNGFEVVRQLAKDLPGVRCIILGVPDTASLVRNALRSAS